MTLKILVTAYDYRPMTGGVATCAFELSKALSRAEGVSLRLLAPEMPGADEFDGHGFYPSTRVPLSKRSEVAALQLIRPLAREIRDWGPDAVLSFLWLPEAVSASFCEAPYFAIAHGVEVLESHSTLRKRVRRLFGPLKRRVFRKAARVLTVSHYTRDLVARHCGVERERIQVIFNAVDSVRFRPAPKNPELVRRYGLEGKSVFVTVTRLVDYKGIDFAIRALKRADRPDAVYLVCGEGEDRPRLEALVRELKMEARVRFTGAVAGAELVDHFNLADAFVLLSREDRVTPNVEGFGIVFLEAAACAKPSIAGRSGGVPDAVLDGETGWLVDPCDEEEISRAMRECLDSPEDTRTRGARARERVETEFTWERVAGRVLSEIRSELGDVRN
jgi:phosphatidyl-myo-inositol dimannoside synthase